MKPGRTGIHFHKTVNQLLCRDPGNIRRKSGGMQCDDDGDADMILHKHSGTLADTMIGLPLPAPLAFGLLRGRRGLDDHAGAGGVAREFLHDFGCFGAGVNAYATDARLA